MKFVAFISTAILLLVLPQLATEEAKRTVQGDILWQNDCPVTGRVEVEGGVVSCYGQGAPTPTPEPSPPSPTPTVIVTNTVTPTPSPTPTELPLARFYDPMNGNPGAPETFVSPLWDVTIHTRGDNLYSLEPMIADHGGTCDGPPATHTIDQFDEAVFRCRDHVMTSLNASDYGVIYLTPGVQVDISSSAVISFAVSTKRTSIERDWIDVWVVPFEDQLQLQLQNSFPDLQGLPRKGLLIRLQATRNAFEVYNINNFVGTLVGRGSVGWETVLVPDRVRRDIIQIDLSTTNIKVWMPQYNLVFVNRAIALDWSTGVVSFGHHSYNPWKDGGLGPNTYHWDNFTIDPAVPMPFIFDQARYYRDGKNVVTLNSPTPEGSYLRFAGIGTNLKFSVDGGLTWTNAIRQPSAFSDSGHFASYRTPIPAGVGTILLAGESWWGGPWHIRDLSVVTP